MTAGDDGRSTAADHAHLDSLLSEEDLALPAHASVPDDPSAFAFDAAADSDAVFPQSVASGGPSPEGVLLWTRVAPERFDPGLSLAVEVARDPSFTDPAYRAVVDDAERIAAHDHTVTVDLDGVLDPDVEYCYRFVYDGVASRVGRCRTLPRRDDSPESVSFAVVACQNYLNGYYGAYSHIAEDDVDFLVHVGDFIYESAAGHFKGLGSRGYPSREIDLPSGHRRVRTLEDYRYLHRTYRKDRHLQRALEAHTLIAGWDDHEIANDLYWDYEVDAPRGDHPRGDDPEFMTQLTADALHAWWEFMPARVRYDPDAERLHERFEIWRAFEFGDLVDLFMTDERLFRHGPREGLPTRRNVRPGNEPPERSMLGDAQREWLIEQLRTSDATWTVWADEVLTIPFMFGAGPATLYPVQGGWDGYTRERQRITEAIAVANLDNVVTLTGDMHCFLAGYKQLRYNDALGSRRNGDDPERLGVELMTPALTSLNVAEAAGVADGVLADPTRRLLSGIVRRMNPHIEHFDSHHWGYVTVEFTPEELTYIGYAVDKTEDSADADREVLVALRVPAGEVRIEDITEAYQQTSSVT